MPCALKRACDRLRAHAQDTGFWIDVLDSVQGAQDGLLRADLVYFVAHFLGMPFADAARKFEKLFAGYPAVAPPPEAFLKE